MLIPKRFLLMTGIFLLNMKLYADIVTDGTVGPITSLSNNTKGHNFMISDKLGQQRGSNLFHSFKEFNVNTGDIVTFTGPDSVTNILARVTGGNHSVIDGTLRSTVPNANLYLLNPSGIIFGDNASLDIKGSFHASTADYLRLGDNGRFSASHPSNSVLSIAPPSAFGFLDNNPASISIQNNFITVSEEKTLSIIGGDLLIDDSILFASGGRINLAAVASAGEVVPTKSGLAVNTFEKLGKITLSHSASTMREQTYINGENAELANIDVSGAKGGQVFIRAGQFISNNGWLFADTYGGIKPSEIDIFIDGDMQLTNGARITADNLGNSQGSHITVKATQGLFFKKRNEEIPANSFEFFLSSLSTIATNNFSSGTGGNIKIINTPVLEMNPGLIQAATAGSGDAGDIVIKNAQQVLLNNGGLKYGSFINAGTKSSGQAGNITINATDQISLSNGV